MRMEQKCAPHMLHPPTLKLRRDREIGGQIGSWFCVDLRSGFLKFFRLLLKTLLNRCGFIDPFFRSVASNVFRYPHAAKMGTTHTAEMSRFSAFGGKSFVVKLARGLGIEREIELIFPAKFEPCLRNRIVLVMGRG